MKQILVKKQDEFKELEKIMYGSWIKLTAPSREELNDISEKTNVPLEFLESALDEDEKPRIEKENGTTLAIFRVPCEEIGDQKREILTIPLAVIITKKNIITVSLKEVKILEDFVTGTVKGFFTNKKTRFLLQMVFRASYYYLKYLDIIERRIDNVESDLIATFRNVEIMSLLRIQKTLVYFKTALASNGIVLDRIQKGKFVRLYEADQDLLEDAIIENKQALDMVNMFTDILGKTTDTYTSVISNNLSKVMKFLTSVTIILSFPTIIASIYGMNVGLPLQNSPHAFLLTILIAFMISGLTAAVFLKKGWF